MFWTRKDTKPYVFDDSGLRSDLDQLRSGLGSLRNMVIEQDTAIKLLQNERQLRETEMMDLRTRYEVLIKRVGQRQKQVDSREGGDDITEVLRRGRRF